MGLRIIFGRKVKSLNFANKKGREDNLDSRFVPSRFHLCLLSNRTPFMSFSVDNAYDRYSTYVQFSLEGYFVTIDGRNID